METLLAGARNRLTAIHGVAAQVEFESRVESGASNFGFKRLVPGAFNWILIVSTCTALPRVVVALPERRTWQKMVSIHQAGGIQLRKHEHNQLKE